MHKSINPFRFLIDMPREPYIIIRPLELDYSQLLNLQLQYEFIFITESLPFKFDMKKHLPGVYHIQVKDNDTYYVRVTNPVYAGYHSLVKGSDAPDCCIVL